MQNTSKFSINWRSRYFRLNIITCTFLLAIGFIWLYPFLWSLFAAFKPQQEMFTAGASLWPKEWVTENFARAWEDAKFSEYFLNTVIYSVCSTVIVLINTAMFGYVLSRYRFPGRRVLYAIILGTLFIPIGSTIIPTFKLVQWLGLLNTRLGVILAMSGGGALYVLLFAGFFSTIPGELFDAAKIDGANFWQMFRLVLPLARPIIATVVIFQFMHTWNNFTTPLIFTFSRPDLRNLAVGMFAFQGEHSFDYSGFAAGTVISVIPVLLVFFVFQGYFVRGLQGAVKQ